MKFNFDSWQEFLDWNVKRENLIAELKQDNHELELIRLRNERDIEELKAELKAYKNHSGGHQSDIEIRNNIQNHYNRRN